MVQGQCGPAYLALIRQSNGQLMLRFDAGGRSVE